MQRILTRAVGLSAIASVAAALSVTSIASAAGSHSGTITIAVAGINDGKSHDVVTGAINDYGTDKSVGQSYEKIVLSQGTFYVDASKFNKSFKFSINPNTCAATGSGFVAGAAVSHGTGAYAGITGSLTLHATITAIAKRVHGKCSDKAEPVAEIDSFSGTGHVSY